MDSLTEVDHMEGPVPDIPLGLVIKTIKLMNCGKAAGTFLTLAEMLKASGGVGIRQLHDLMENIMNFGRIITEWEENITASLFKGKGVAPERCNHQGLKLLDQIMKVLERVAENFLW